MRKTSLSGQPDRRLPLLRENRGRGLLLHEGEHPLLRERTVLPADKAYAGARRIWNGAVSRFPAVFALCETVEDVRAAVWAARTNGLPLSVRGGGHDWAGRALRENGLVIDLSGMRHVEIDAAAQVATVAGGARGMDVVAAAAAHGLTAVTGHCGAVGMAGLTLGGGYGPLTPRLGLALDNLLGADIMLANCTRVTASADEHPDLFWALRGGGGNFGVVTSMRVRLHPIEKVLSGTIIFPWAEAETVLRRYGDMIETAPDELAVMAGILPGPEGAPVLCLSPTWSGEMARGEAVMQDLQRLGTPMRAQIMPMTYGELLGMYDAHVVDGRHYAVETRWLPKLTPDAISSIVAAGGKRTSPFTMIALHHFHGAATRVPENATAFGLRKNHFLVEIIAAWEPGLTDDGATHRQWAKNLGQNLAPAALPGGYANLLGPDAWDQIIFAYGSNISRLQHVKQRFDPEGVFTSAIPLPA